VVYMSATPGDYELRVSRRVVEQIVRPTGLIDPHVEIRPTKGQVDDLIEQIRARAEQNQRVLVTTLTKKMAEDLTEYLLELGMRVRYLHSEVDTLERVEILRALRLGEFDVLVGINLLREGLDLPEVSLVAILDADKEGFLRSDRSLIQTAGRTARNVNGRVILYADNVTGSMQRMLDETRRRRIKQVEYNSEHGIVPKTIYKTEEEVMAGTAVADMKNSRDARREREKTPLVAESILKYMTDDQKKDLLEELRAAMRDAAKDLEFERAAELRDEIGRLEQMVK
ncbi:MAG TPA: helicase-related protein, partial [Bacteroidota bacterium]